HQPDRAEEPSAGVFPHHVDDSGDAHDSASQEIGGRRALETELGAEVGAVTVFIARHAGGGVDRELTAEFDPGVVAAPRSIFDWLPSGREAMGPRLAHGKSEARKLGHGALYPMVKLCFSCRTR